MAAGDLSTLANVKQWLNLTSSGDDALLTRLLTSVSNFIQSWLGRQLLSASYTELLDGQGGRAIILGNYPVTAVASLYIGGVSIPASSGVSASGYVVTPYGVTLRGYFFTRNLSNVTITYTAGFASLPVEIEQACLELIALRYAGRLRPGVSSKAVGGETVSYTDQGLTDAIETTLQQYRKVVPV